MAKKIAIDTPTGKQKIDYSSVELSGKEEEVITDDMAKSYELQKAGWLVINIYTQDRVKFHVLIKK